MKASNDIPLRVLLSWPAMIVGALLGYGIAEFAWRATHSVGIQIGGQPPLPISFYVVAILVSIAVSVLGLALVRFRDLPGDE